MGCKRVNALIALLLSLCLFTACGDKSEGEEEQQELNVVPNAYFIGSEVITAVQPEAGLYLSQLTTAEDGSFIYTYAGFTDVCVSVQAYTEMLTGEDHGFKVVDGETFRSANAPDYTVTEGTVSLSKDSENEKITVVRLDWTEGQCVASISIEDKPVVEEPEKKKPKNNYGLSHTGAVDYLKELDPAVLQLDGESMDEYKIYVRNGFTYVDGEACLRIEIFTASNKAQTNAYMGKYFMSGNGEHIYRLNDEGIAEEMDQNQ